MTLNIGRVLRVAAAAFFVACAPALAQMGVPNHGVPVSHGGGASGTFNAVGPCLTGIPIIGAGVSADPVCGRVPNAGVAQGNGATIRGNPTSALADVQDFTIQGLANKASPDTNNDRLLLWDNAAGAFKNCTVAQCGAASGVSTLNGQAGTLKLPVAAGGRATLTTGVSITTADVTGATTIYYTPTVSDFVAIYDGANWVPRQIAELSLALDSNAAHTGYHQGSRNFDLFVIYDSGTARFGSGPTWNAGAGAGSDTARGTGAASTEIQLLNGIWTNKNQIVIRYGSAVGNTVTVPVNQATYVATCRMTADGVTEDSITKRWCWNAYNQAERRMYYTDPAASWQEIASSTIRQANSNTSNQCDFVSGLAGVYVKAKAMQYAFNSTATFRNFLVGFGLDSTTTFTVGGFVSTTYVQTGEIKQFTPVWEGYPGLGRHFLSLNEQGAGTDTQTTNHGGTGGLTCSILG